MIFVHYALTCCVFSFVEERFIFKKMICDYVEVSSLKKHASRTLFIGEDSMKTYCKGTGTGTRRAFFFFSFLNIVFVLGVYISLCLRKYSTLFRPGVISIFYLLPEPEGELIRPPLLTPRILKLWQRNLEGR